MQQDQHRARAPSPFGPTLGVPERFSCRVGGVGLRANYDSKQALKFFLDYHSSQQILKFTAIQVMRPELSVEVDWTTSGRLRGQGELSSSGRSGRSAVTSKRRHRPEAQAQKARVLPSLAPFSPQSDHAAIPRQPQSTHIHDHPPRSVRPAVGHAVLARVRPLRTRHIWLSSACLWA